MAGTGIMAGIYSSPSPYPYPIEKIGDSPHPYPYPVNARIPRQNGDGFGQYPRRWVYLPSLPGMRSMVKSTSLLGGNSGISSGKTSMYSSTIGILLIFSAVLILYA